MRFLSAVAALLCVLQLSHSSEVGYAKHGKNDIVTAVSQNAATHGKPLNPISAAQAPSSDSSHEQGRCAMYGNCGKRSIFGAPLPCPTDQKALPPSPEALQVLNRVCGADFDSANVCCLMDQLTKLEDNLKKVDPLISSCPACRKNFYDFFCKFTCSADQLQFTKITGTSKAVDTGNDIVTELTQYVDPDYAAGFFDSCKNLKFSATNGYAMDLIGGGAKNYQEFLKFLGDEKPLLGGLPFQINFRYDVDKAEKNQGLVARNGSIRPCDDPEYKCACSDCPVSCPVLPKIRPSASQCKIGVLPCFSFAVLIVWIVLFVALGGFHIYLARMKKRNFDLINDIYEEDDFDNDDLDFVVSAHSLHPYDSGFLAPVKDFQSYLIAAIEVIFAYCGYFCASYPAITIVVSLAISALFSSGLFFLQLETDPVSLWVSPNDPAVKEKEYFETNFGEWFRVEQIIISSKNELLPVLSWDNLEWWFEKEQQLFSFSDGNDTLSLEDFCFKPLGGSCALQSFTQYFDGQIANVDKLNWQAQLKGCADLPVNCLPSFQQPLKPNILFSEDNPLTAKAFIVTVLIDSKTSDPEYTAKVQQYERRLSDWILEIRNDDEVPVNIDFNTEISLTDELSKFSKSDITTITISYLVMFFYASLALAGKIPTSLRAENFVLTRFQLGLSGIIIIVISVLASAGVFAFFGVKSTLIIAEVIPFLILAIGVDNIFLIVHELNMVNDSADDVDIPTRISAALGKVGPSCLISAVLQISMFLLAANVSMPAVKNFAFYSAGAVFFTFLLQVTAFVSILAIDQRRLEEGRVDCAPFIQTSVHLGGADDDSNVHDHLPRHVEYDFSQIIRKRYAPWLLQTSNKRKVLTAFVLWLGICLSVLPNISLGLDQRMAVPADSYLVDYFNAAYKYLNVGPPVFFVAKNLDLTVRDNQKKLCGKFSACDEFSVANILEQEYKRVEQSTIAEPVSNWLDDFFNWLNPNLDQCCRLKKLPKTTTASTLTSAFSKEEREFCSPYAPSRACESCYENHDPPYDMTMEGLPEGSDFMFYFKQWIQEPSDPCPLGGKVTYGSSVSVDQENNSIISSYLRTSHRPLRSQGDFIDAFRHSKRILEEIKHYEGSRSEDESTATILKSGSEPEFFAFSPFYVFFVQYQSIVRDVFVLLLSALAIIWIVSTLLLGSVRVATILVVTVASILSSMGGVMAFWLISLNAVSLVNLIICTGLAVEFTIHVARAYIVSEVEDDEEMLFNSFMSTDITSSDARTMKAYNALSTVGGSVLRGITITKFIGIAVLAFTTSKIFEVYYFRMWFALVVVAGIHALVLLPVLLSMFGDVTTRKGRYENGIFST